MKRHYVMIINVCGVSSSRLITRQLAIASGEKKTVGLVDWRGGSRSWGGRLLLTKGGLSGATMHGDASAVDYPGPAVATSCKLQCH